MDFFFNTICLFVFSLVLLSCNFINKKFKYKCWDDINFEKTERLLLKSSIKEKIPFYEYYKRQKLSEGQTKEDILKDFFYNDRKQKHELTPLFVLIYNNGLKAIFKQHKTKHSESFYNSILSAYKISKFLKLKVVPPAVMRKIDEEKGVVSLFIENIHDRKSKIYHLEKLNPVQKSNLYFFLFLIGIVDPHLDNILVSKKCFKPVFIDTDNMYLLHTQYGKNSLFELFLKEKAHLPFLSQSDYEKAPFEKSIKLNNPSYHTLNTTFPGLSRRNMKKLIEAGKKYNSLYYFKYKENYWIHLNKPVIYEHLLPITAFSPKLTQQLKSLDRAVLSRLIVRDTKKTHITINGILYRKSIILKEVEKLKKNSTF